VTLTDSVVTADAAPAGDHLRRRLSTWLLRPFIDLGPCATGPLYARGIEAYWRAFVDPQLPPFSLQRTLPPAFRTQLMKEARDPRYEVSDPRERPESLRTARWQELCGALDAWDGLSPERKFRLVSLLHSLCLYETVLGLVPAPGAGIGRRDERSVDLEYWRASARYALGLPDRTSNYTEADLSVFESITEEAPDAVPAAFNSALKIFVHKVKTGAPLATVKSWAAKLERSAADTVGRVDAFTCALLTSRYHRAMGFLPQRRGDREGVVRQMDLAEQHALAVEPRTDAERLLYLENLHPLMESRTKEALWLGDSELALARSLKVVELDPYDCKAWVEVGEVRMKRKEWARAAEAYVVAGMLGPPASAIGRHMAGICFRELGEDLLAAFFFKETLEVDRLGISPRLEIRDLPESAVFAALKEWDRQSVEL